MQHPKHDFHKLENRALGYKHRQRKPTRSGAASESMELTSYGFNAILYRVSWVVAIGDEFEPEYDALHEDSRTEILARARLLQQFGPQLKPPRLPLNGSRHANMKQLCFSAADGEWRAVFAFDTKRKAILLVAGGKSGGSEKRFYNQLIRKADGRFDARLARLKEERK
jgi:hypothetical protein